MSGFTAGSVTVEELLGSRTVDVAQNGLRGVRLFRAESDGDNDAVAVAQQFVAAMLQNRVDEGRQYIDEILLEGQEKPVTSAGRKTGGVGWFPYQAYPGTVGVYAVDAKIRPAWGDKQKATTGTVNTDGGSVSGVVVYDYADIEVFYERVPDTRVSVSISTQTKSRTPNGYTVNSRKWEHPLAFPEGSADIAVTVPKEFSDFYLEGNDGDLSRRLNEDLLMPHVGKVNEEEFGFPGSKYTYPEKTLLFYAAELAHGSWFGLKRPDVTLRFKHNPNGWNKIYDSKAANADISTAYQEVTPEPFPLYDLTYLMPWSIMNRYNNG